MGETKEKRLNLFKTGSKNFFPGAAFILVFIWAGLLPGPVLAGWFVDPARFHISAHGQMGCLECHDDVADLEKHPDPSAVTRSPRSDFETDKCAMCHDQVMADLEEGNHGRKSAVDPVLYENCVLCHDPHYVSRQGDNQQGKFLPGVPKQTQCGACHEEQKALPPPEEEEAECLKCHQPESREGPAGIAAVSFICRECHFGKKSDDRSALPLIDPAAYLKTAHAKESCLTCHPQAAGYNHDRQKPGDCLQCHTRHDEKTAHDAHLTVACQACHLPGAVPHRDFATKKIGWSLVKDREGPSRVHEFSTSGDEETCRRCHFSGNRIGAAAFVLPPKSIICMPCHAATFSTGDPISLVSLLVFLIGLVSAALFWFSGTLAGPGSKAGQAAGAVLSAVFSARIWSILKALAVDGLFQRRLYKYSPARWAIHTLIFWPFVFRFVWGLTALGLTLWWPENSLGWILVNKNHPLPALLFDLSGISILAGAALAMARRFLAGKRDGIVNLPSQDRLALALMGGIVAVGFLLEGMRIAMTSAPGQAHFAFIGYAVSLFLRGMNGLSEVYGYVWYGHAVLTGAFLAYLPFSRMFHILMGPLAIAVKAATRERHEGPEPGNSEQ